MTSTWRCHIDSLLADSLSCWSRLLRGFYRAVLSILCFWHFALLSNELHSVLSQYYPTLRGLMDRGLQFGSSEYLWKVNISMCSQFFCLYWFFSRVKPHCWLTYIIGAIFSVIPTWWVHMDSLLVYTLSCWRFHLIATAPFLFRVKRYFLMTCILSVLSCPSRYSPTLGGSSDRSL